jgi:hypothetical protein
MENSEETKSEEQARRDPKRLIFGIILILIGLGLIAWTLSA